MKNQKRSPYYFQWVLTVILLATLLSELSGIPLNTIASAAGPEPTYLWHTFYGSASKAGAMVVDSAGNILVGGATNAAWDKTSALHGYSGKTDLQAVKLDGNGNLLWHTFFGSADYDYDPTVAVDSGGNVYLAGYSYSTWNGPANQAPLHPFNPGNNGTSDIVVVKLDPNGNYLWHTFYGGTGNDRAFTMTVDGAGRVDVFGLSNASWSDPAAPLNLYTGGADLVILQLDGNGVYGWHTFFGSSQNEFADGITTDSANNIYLSGGSQGSWGSPLHSFTGMEDITILKLNSSGAYQWHTFYGSGTNDEATELKVGSDGNLYIEGWSSGAWTAPNAPLHAYANGYDVLVMSLTSGGQYRWHTFYGSASADFTFGDQGGALAVDGNGGVYVTGQSSADWGANAPAAPVNPYTGMWDVFLLKLDGAGAYQWHAFFGSGSDDWGEDLVVRGNSLYSTGFSNGGWGPYGIVAAPKHAFSGTQNLFVMKFNLPVQQSGNVQVFLPLVNR